MTHADAVREVAEQFGCTVPIFGMVKDDRHRTRALVTPEGREIGIVNDQAVFSLIGQIQEETHRFAITYHHQHHTKSAMRSALDGVPGLGPTGQRGVSAIGRIHPACRLFSQDFSRNTIVYLPVN